MAVAVAALAVAALGASSTSPAVPTEVPGQHLPVTVEHRYRMDGRVRLLLLWVGRENVGTGTIRWRGGTEDDYAYELLIGSDPRRAPAQLNKWGYLIEHRLQGQSTVVGLIAQGNEDRPGDVRAKAAEQRAFDTVRGRVAPDEACARVGTLHAASHLTAEESRTVLDDVLADRSLSVTCLGRSAGVRGGFLSTLTELLRASVAVDTAASGKVPAVRSLRYIHGAKVYELRLAESTPLRRFEKGGRTFDNVVRSRFETGEAGTRDATRFDLVYRTSGELSGVPILISYQPRWWLHVDLVLQT